MISEATVFFEERFRLSIDGELEHSPDTFAKKLIENSYRITLAIDSNSGRTLSFGRSPKWNA